MLALLFGEHHVEVERTDTELHRIAGAVELLRLIYVVIKMFKLGVRSVRLLEFGTLLFINEESTSLAVIIWLCGCTRPKHPGVVAIWYFRQTIELKLALLIDKTSSLLERHLPDEVAWADGRHLVKLTPVVVVDEVDQTVGVL